MTTKSPALIKPFPSDSIEKIVYTIVYSVPTHEPNDQNRLGYQICQLLKSKQGTLEEAVKESKARLNIKIDDVVKIIRDRLAEQGLYF